MNNKKTILVVEDVCELRDLLVELFLGEGYNALGASNGCEALEILGASKELPALILLDLTMPVMDGWRFRKAQTRDPRIAAIPVVVMTAAGDPQARAVQVGAKALLKKPFEDIENILEVVRCCA